MSIHPHLRNATSVALGVALGPVLWLQGKRVRRSTPRLPEAAGPCTGEHVGADPPLTLLVLGESTAAGVGAADHVEGLVGQLARVVSGACGRSVRWRVLGRSGATARVVRAELLAPAEDLRADVAVLVLGVNDVLALRGPGTFARELEQLIASLRERCGEVPVVLAAVPPMGRFPALPQPLRAVLGLRAALLDEAALRLSRALDDVHHVPMPPSDRGGVAAFFCADGFHPSPHGYRRWAEALGEVAVAVSLGRRTPEEGGG